MLVYQRVTTNHASHISGRQTPGRRIRGVGITPQMVRYAPGQNPRGEERSGRWHGRLNHRKWGFNYKKWGIQQLRYGI